MNKRLSNKGVALLMVLWILMVLTVIVSEFCYSMKTHVNVTRNFKESTQAYYIALAGFNKTVEEIVKQVNTPAIRKEVDYDAAEESEEEEIQWRINTDIPASAFGKGEYKVWIDNDSGKVNVNLADKSLLMLMLNGFALEEQEKDVIVDSILDWKDADSNHRINGAEDQYYQSLPNPYQCKNGTFDSVEELLLVRGVTPEIFYGGLDQMTTVIPAIAAPKPIQTRRRSRSTEYDYNQLNMNAIPEKLWLSFPGMTEEIVSLIVEFRKTQDFQSINQLLEIVGAEVYTGVYRYLTLKQSPYFTIRSVGTIQDSRIFEGIEAIIRMDNRIKNKYQVIQWKDGMTHYDFLKTGVAS